MKYSLFQYVCSTSRKQHVNYFIRISNNIAFTQLLRIVFNGLKINEKVSLERLIKEK